MGTHSIISGSKIMIVDDSILNIEILGSVLKSLGAETKSFLDGRMALQEMESFMPDLILLDITMPFLDGFEVCKRIKKNKKFEEIPVIFISALNEIHDKTQAFGIGAVDYITKPFDIREVELRVYTHLKLLRLQQNVNAYNEQLRQLVQKQYSQILKEKENVAKSQIAMIVALAKLADCRDNDTGDHLERVKFYCQSFSKVLADHEAYQNEIDEIFITTIMHASVLHDIGKVGIPDYILCKSSGLTDEEFIIMKTHTKIGANTIGSIVKQYPNNRFLIMAMEMAFSHHENWDGSGYPLGISGKKIPLCARIIAICDVYDALRAKRSYKNTLSHKEACTIIACERGKRFEPFMVDLFLDNHEIFDYIYEQNR